MVAGISRLQPMPFGIEVIANLEPVVSRRVAQVEKRGTESGGELTWGCERANSGKKLWKLERQVDTFVPDSYLLTLL